MLSPLGFRSLHLFEKRYILGLALDELLAMAEVELCRQRRERLEKKYQRESQKIAE